MGYDQNREGVSPYRQSISGPNRIVMASTGQSRRQEPQCQHSSGYLTVGSFFLLVKMDHIQRAMQVAGSAFLALLQIDHRGHGLLLSSPLFPSQGWNRIVIQFLKLRLDPLLRFPQHDLSIIFRPCFRVIGTMMIDAKPGFLSGQRSGAHHLCDQPGSVPLSRTRVSSW